MASGVTSNNRLQAAAATLSTHVGHTKHLCTTLLGPFLYTNSSVHVHASQLLSSAFTGRALTF